MTKKDMATFVKELSANIAKEIVTQIDDGTIPSDWYAYELRMLLAHRHRQSADMVPGAKDKRSKISRRVARAIVENKL